MFITSTKSHFLSVFKGAEDGHKSSHRTNAAVPKAALWPLGLRSLGAEKNELIWTLLNLLKLKSPVGNILGSCGSSVQTPVCHCRKTVDFLCLWQWGRPESALGAEWYSAFYICSMSPHISLLTDVYLCLWPCQRGSRWQLSFKRLAQ